MGTTATTASSDRVSAAMQELAADLDARASTAYGAAKAAELAAEQAEAARAQNDSLENAVRAIDARSRANELGARAFSYGQQATDLMRALGWGPVPAANGLFRGYGPGESEESDDATFAAGERERAARANSNATRGGIQGLKGWNSVPSADEVGRAIQRGANRLGGEPAPEPPEPGAWKGPILTPPWREEGDEEREGEEGEGPAPPSRSNETDFDRAGLEAARASRQQALDDLNREIAARQAQIDETNKTIAYGQAVLDRAQALQRERDGRRALREGGIPSRGFSLPNPFEAAPTVPGQSPLGPSTIAAGSGTADGVSGGSGSGGRFGGSVADRATGAASGRTAVAESSGSFPGAGRGEERTTPGFSPVGPYGGRFGPNPTIVEVSELAPGTAQKERSPTPVGPVNPGMEIKAGATAIFDPGALTDGEVSASNTAFNAGTALNSAFSPDPTWGSSAALQGFAKNAPEVSAFKGGFANNPGWAWGVDPGPAGIQTGPASGIGTISPGSIGFGTVAVDPAGGFTNAFGGSPSAQSMGYGVVGVNVGEIDGLVGAGTMNSAASSNPAFGGSAALQGFAQNAFAQEVAPSFGSAPAGVGTGFSFSGSNPGFAAAIDAARAAAAASSEDSDPAALGGEYGGRLGSAPVGAFAPASFEMDPGLTANSYGQGGEAERGREGERGQGFRDIGVDTSSRGEGRSVGTAGTGGGGNAFETGGGGYARGSSAPNAPEGPTFNPADGSIEWGGGDVTPGPRGGQAMNTNGETDYGQTSESNTSEKNAFDSDLDAEKDKDLDFGGNAFGSGFGRDLGLDLGAYA